MPELPEVETVVRSLARLLPGRRITAVRVGHQPSIAGTPAPPACLRGLRVEKVFRRGKFIRIALESGLGLAIHLRMTGWLGVVRAEAGGARRSLSLPHLRLWFELDGGQAALVFCDPRTFGRVWCGENRILDALPALAQLGPDALAIGMADFARRLRSRRGRLKPLLLNQKFLAGLGNIYTDEVLFAARLHPLADAGEISARQAAALRRAIRKVLAAAIKAGGTTISDFQDPDGATGWFQRRLRVYGRAGLPCVRCGTEIKRFLVGQRGTWFCPRCQKQPSA